MKLSKWCNIYCNAEPYYHAYNTTLSGFGTQQVLHRNSWGFNGYLSNSFSMKNSWKFECSSWFNFQNKATIYTSKPLGSMNISMQKGVWNDRAQLRMSITDIFNTQKWEQTASTENI
ncbi:MAG: outer membrane beta-barrel protein [Chitinophagaceae bacterium]